MQTSFELIEGLGAAGTAEDLTRNATFAAHQWEHYVDHRIGLSSSFHACLVPQLTLVDVTGAYASAPGTTVSMISLQDFINSTTLAPMLAALDTVLEEVYAGTPQETQIELQRSWLDNATIPQVECVRLYLLLMSSAHFFSPY